MTRSNHPAAAGVLALWLVFFPLCALAGEGGPMRPAAQAVAQPAGQPAAQQQPGRQITVSPIEAFAIMAGEAEKGSAQAMLTLGTFYEQGLGTARNFVKALEWYEKAAAAGSAEAYYRVGVAYEIGLGNTGDPEKAFNSFEKAAELDFPDGFYKLASLYITGTVVQKNEAWGVSLLNRAVGLGHMGAANDMGVIFLEGSYGQAKDVAKAFEMFAKAADLGNPEAMKNIGVLYRDGIGRPADPAQELKWYTLALAAGYRPESLVAAVGDLRAELGEDVTKRIGDEVDAWITAFQARHQPPVPGAAPER